jgi:HEAT repeat protein
MRQLEHLKRVQLRWPRILAALGFFASVAAVGWNNLARAEKLPVSPVEKLRQRLQPAKIDVQTKDRREARGKALKELVAKIESVGDMSQALVLSEWQDGSLVYFDLAEIDGGPRRELAKRFVSKVGLALKSKDPTSRAAAAGLVGDTATLARGDTQSNIVLPTLEGLAKDLVPLTKDTEKSESVRLQAIRSLGRIPTKAKSNTVAPLGEVFARPSLAERRAAAGALDNLVRTLEEVRKTASPLGVTGAGRRLEREERIQISQAIILAARKGLRDPKDEPDVEVRRLCARALFQPAALLSDDLIGPPPLIDDPPTKAMVDAEREELAPLLNAFSGVAPDLARSTKDPDPGVRLLVIRTLEEMGDARQKLRRRAAYARDTTPGDKKGDDEKKNSDKQKDAGDKKKDDPLLQALEDTLFDLTEALKDPKPQVRLAAVDTLETLGDNAARAAPRLAWALLDPDRFVRWAAARALGRMTPEAAGADAVVPYLIRMLDDPDLDLRLIAAQSLERYGPAAKTAVPALAKTTRKGDPEIRRAAIRALIGVGTDAKDAIPDIAAALGNSDVRVRRTAAEALARFGPLAQNAKAALRKSLDDSDAEVRRYAEDSLLQLK